MSTLLSSGIIDEEATARIMALSNADAKKECVALWEFLSANPDKEKRDWKNWDTLAHVESNCVLCVRKWSCLECFLYDIPGQDCASGWYRKWRDKKDGASDARQTAAEHVLDLIASADEEDFAVVV